MKIIIDAMGGDNAPRSTVEGAVLAVREFGIDAALVGREPEIRACLEAAQAGDAADKLQIVHAEQVIDMCDSATSVTKEKKDSSLAAALRMLGAGEGDALVSSGNTGAVLVGSTMYVKRIRGVRRAALAPVLPTDKGGALLIDSGANVECTPEYLLQFAYMGSFYAQKQMGIAKPKVGLMNNGAEASKGTPVLRETYALLQEAAQAGRLNYIGNIEGRDVPFGAADVVLCDGFTGNVLLKTYEGVGMYFAGEMKKMFLKNLGTKMAALLVKDGLGAFKKKMDYKEVGGAPLLGIAKPVIKAHGSSDPRAFKSAIRQAVQYAESGIIASIAENIDHMTLAAGDEKN